MGETTLKLSEKVWCSIEGPMVIAIFRLHIYTFSFLKRALYKDIGKHSNFKVKINEMFLLINGLLLNKSSFKIWGGSDG